MLDFEREVRARIHSLSFDNRQYMCDENSKRTPYERTRRIFIPGIAAILTVWLVQSALGLVNWTPTAPTRGGASWIFRVHIPFTHLPLFIHWDLIVSFAAAGAISALYGAFVNSSPKQRYIAVSVSGRPS